MRGQDLSKYIYSNDFCSMKTKGEEYVMESLLKQAGVSSFDRFIVETLGLFKVFDNMDDAMECFEAMVYYKHNANLYVGYVMPDGNLFICDSSKGFHPVYRSAFAFIPARTSFDIENMKKTLHRNGWVDTV